MNRLRIFNKAGDPPAAQNKHWYSLKASGEAEARSIEVYVYGEIGTWGITANQFVRDLAALDDLGGNKPLTDTQRLAAPASIIDALRPTDDIRSYEVLSGNPLIHPLTPRPSCSFLYWNMKTG